MMRFLPASSRANLAMEFKRLTQAPGMIVSEYDAHFTQLSRYAPDMVPTNAPRIERFIQGLANLMFTTLSSHIRRITYTKAVETTLHIEAR